MRRWERKQYLLKNIRPLFKSDQEAASYVDKKLRDKKRALAERRLRFRRKAYMNDFNCVATVTYFYGHSYRGMYVVGTDYGEVQYS